MITKSQDYSLQQLYAVRSSSVMLFLQMLLLLYFRSSNNQARQLL